MSIDSHGCVLYPDGSYTGYLVAPTFGGRYRIYPSGEGLPPRYADTPEEAMAMVSRPPAL